MKPNSFKTKHFEYNNPFRISKKEVICSKIARLAFSVAELVEQKPLDELPAWLMIYARRCSNVWEDVVEYKSVNEAQKAAIERAVDYIIDLYINARAISEEKRAEIAETLRADSLDIFRAFGYEIPYGIKLYYERKTRGN